MLRTLLSLLLAVGVCASTALGQISARQDKWIGSILKGRAGNVKEVPADFHYLFEQVTPENAGKWDLVEPVRDSMDFSALDEMYAYAQERGMRFTIHSITRLEQQPSWLASLPPEEIRAEFEEWIAALAARYPDTYSVDVVNEAAHGKLGTPPVKAALGGPGESGWDDVVWVYRKAKEYFPNSILLLSDYDVLKSDSVNTFPQIYRNYNDLAKTLADAGVVDALAPQGHWLGGRDFDYEHVTGRLDELYDLVGLPIHISEFDLESDSDAYQLEKYQTSLRAMLDHPHVVGVTLWGYKENGHWLDDAYLVAEDGTERSALTWLRDYLRAPDLDAERLEAEDWDAMFGMYYTDDSTGVRVASTPLTTAAGGDSAFVRFRHVDLEGADAIALRYRASGDGHVVSLVLDSAHLAPTWSQTLGDTGGEFRTDTFALGTALASVRDAHVVYRPAAGDLAGDFTLDYVGFGAYAPVGDTMTSGALATPLPASAFEVFPNPAEGSVSVRPEVAATVELLTATGRRVYGPYVAAAGESLTLPLGDLARGVYVVRAAVGDRVGVRRLILK